MEKKIIKKIPAAGAEVNISSRLDVGITSKATAPAVPINKIDLSIGQLLYKVFPWDITKGSYFNYVSMFLPIFDQLSTLVSMLTTVPDNSYSTVVRILQTK